LFNFQILKTPMRYLIILFLFIPSAVFCQENIAIRQIRQLKDGVLLVRLKTKEKVIMGLKEIGNQEQALEVEEEQKQENLEITSALIR